MFGSKLDVNYKNEYDVKVKDQYWDEVFVNNTHVWRRPSALMKDWIGVIGYICSECGMHTDLLNKDFDTCIHIRCFYPLGELIDRSNKLTNKKKWWQIWKI